ncbi:hypothetical protein UF75_4741 [Desulfosporosinus sp. I2]|nr:hypothetical protein UF75_4741 [Desulfosporosinus sp. I2]
MLGDINDFLKQNSWAVIGVSSDKAKYGYKVYNQLKKIGLLSLCNQSRS